MRLSSLKLAGFKSFADSATLHFKANRTAVVGPNGCGKSNVIDAIRWVMGESNARQLRGGSMQDVIFTGTAKRKPVGMASVELRFENTYGKLGGTYNAYSELAVRRQVNRDGKSEYFLNGTRCRRRDITDIFLGTGLGPRSYAVIEQGMINRLIDAKPEEMRVFIEEAAGVSRYQARRRETLQHLEHTEQNLARLDDIALELKSQLKTLKRQAEAAIQYKTLEQEIKTLKIEILSFQSEQSLHLQQEYTVQMNALGEEFKLIRSELNTIEHDLESTSALFQRLIQQSTPLQTEWQTAEKKCAELKMVLEQKQSLFQQNSVTLGQLEQQKVQTKERIQLSDIQLEHLHEQIEQQNTDWHQAEADTQQAEQRYADLQTQHVQIQSQFEQLKAQIEKYQQQKSQMTAQMEQLGKSIDRTQQQKQTLQQQLAHISSQVQDDAQRELQHALEQQQHEVFVLEQKRDELNAVLTQLHAQQAQQKAQLDPLETQIKVLQTEQKNLQQLVTKQSSKSQVGSTQLLQILQLKEAGRSYASLIEKLYNRWMDAHYLDQHQPFQSEIARQVRPATMAPQRSFANLVALADWIEAPQLSLWNDIWIIDTLDAALALQSSLSVGQSLLTLDGYHVARDWMIGLDYDHQSQSSGMLSHRIRLEEIAHELPQCIAQRETLINVWQTLEQQCEMQQQNMHQIQRELKDLRPLVQKTELEIARQHASAQAYVLQQQQLQQQLTQLEQQLEEDAMQRDDLEIDLHALQLKLDAHLPQYKIQQLEWETLTEQKEQAFEQLQQHQQTRELCSRQLAQTQQQIELLEKDLSFLKTQMQQIVAQMEQAKKFVDPVQLELPALETEFSEQFQKTEALQKQWKEWQLELNHVQEKQQTLTEQRHDTEQKDEKIRAALEQKRLAWQATKSDLAHYQEQLEALNAQTCTGLKIDLESHQQRLDKTLKQFEKLGAVNLAASQEYEEVSARFDELNHQMQDLENTVNQLKDAMKSIDLETRKLFMTTFDRVNHELQDLFPKVFNGGEAALSLEDDWQSGVKLMARPPGKRNSSLALLSGGEKALTALALVFAIFRLNPAPFCVLDEVDAPLDDANVQRFCNLVKELSEHVQFIYITHNKLAMTMATDLLGVTMPEPGTSKLVTVNLEEAKEYGLVTES